MGRVNCMQARNILGRVADHIAINQSQRYHSSAPHQLPRPTFSFHRCLSPSDHKFFTSSLPTSKISRFDCVGSIESWLIMVDIRHPPESFSSFANPWSYNLLHDHKHPTSRACFATANFFFDEISGERVLLPPQSTIACRGSDQPSFLEKVVASSSPTSPRCLVAALCSQGRLAFCRPGDETWTLIDQGTARGVDFGDIEIINGKLHAALRDAPELLIVFNIESDADRPPAYFAQDLFMLQPVPIPSKITTKELFMKNIPLSFYHPKTNGLREGIEPGKLKGVLKENWLNIQYWMHHQAQAQVQLQLLAYIA